MHGHITGERLSENSAKIANFWLCTTTLFSPRKEYIPPWIRAPGEPLGPGPWGSLGPGPLGIPWARAPGDPLGPGPWGSLGPGPQGIPWARAAGEPLGQGPRGTLGPGPQGNPWARVPREPLGPRDGDGDNDGNSQEIKKRPGLRQGSPPHPIHPVLHFIFF